MHISAPVSSPSLAESQADNQVMQTSTGGSNSDPFDGSAEPIVYMSDNRMPVMMELSRAIIYIIFATLILALISILPGVRRKRMTSFVGLFTLIVVGTSILLAFEGSHWLTGTLKIHKSPYGALTTELINGKLEVNIGLSSTNVTLSGHLVNWNEHVGTDSVTTTSGVKSVDYNERFHWDQPDRMANEHLQALRRGLPYPILTITEFLSQDSDGFSWMRQLRRAGYFASLALYAALASWLLTALVMCVLPVYLAHMMQLTGALMMASVWIYTLLIESPKSFVVRLGESPVEFEFGHTYMITFLAGALSMFSGALMFILQLYRPHDQVTIMDCDDYVKNQRVLNVIPPEVSLTSNGKANLKAAPLGGTNQVSTRNHSVVIPISDIEEKFSQRMS